MFQSALQVAEQLALFFAGVALVRSANPGIHPFISRAYGALPRVEQRAIAIATIARSEGKHANGGIAPVERRARALISANFIQHMQRPFARGKRGFPLAQHKNIARFAQADVHIPYRAAVQHIRHKAMKAQDFPRAANALDMPQYKMETHHAIRSAIVRAYFCLKPAPEPFLVQKTCANIRIQRPAQRAPAIPQPVDGDAQRDQRRHKRCAHDHQRGKGARTRR